jgi:hypothetical protein
VLPGHDQPDLERVVERAPTHLVVEKTGRSAELVEYRSRLAPPREPHGSPAGRVARAAPQTSERGELDPDRWDITR